MQLSRHYLNFVLLHLKLLLKLYKSSDSDHISAKLIQAGETLLSALAWLYHITHLKTNPRQ
jgi:hypothetical protein